MLRTHRSVVSRIRLRQMQLSLIQNHQIMSTHQNLLHEQIDLIQKAMKTAGVWSDKIPSWAKNYQLDQIPNIWQWLQYIYLPMRLNGTITEPHYIAPIVSPYMTTESKFREILQLVIELDSISSTIEKK